MTDTIIAVLPYGQSLGRHLADMSLDDLHWPLGRPARAKGKVGDLTVDDHLIVFPKTNMHTKLRWGTRAKVSLLIVEPRSIHRRHLNALLLTHHRFHRVFSHDPRTLALISNARFLAAASTCVPEYNELTFEKTANASLIASSRNDLDGHRLRHVIVNKVRAKELDVDILGRGYQPFEKKHEGLAKYRFSVVIENTRCHGYFSEKLVDALLCETIPIYWGAPDIADHFDPTGMIICQSQDEIVKALENADEEQYLKMKPSLLKAKATAEKSKDYRSSAAQILQNEVNF